jgi:hypothetical protein
MAKRKRTKEQTMIYKTPHRKRTSNTNPLKTRGEPEGLAVPVPLVAYVVCNNQDMVLLDIKFSV